MASINNWKAAVLAATGARDAMRGERIQSLWSGYGEIVRINLIDAPINSVVLKAIDLPKNMSHPRGWSGHRSHERKVRSYEVERHWYEHYANQCENSFRVPRCYGTYESDQQQWIVLEDLDGAGFDVRRQGLSIAEAKLCLTWFANFHAKFLSNSGEGLWEQGCYWHLETRPDEFAAMSDVRLKSAASSLDSELANCQFETLVHGDAKVANFCFSEDMKRVAAVDFQYVGRGCGIKDIAYFMGSCLTEEECSRFENELLDFYFSALGRSLVSSESDVDFTQLEIEWRRLYPIAWTDFYRFLQGWSPSHSKINAYTLTLYERALNAIA